MPYYYPIQNEKLRYLVMASESIHSLDEGNIQKMIFQVANLPVEAQQPMIEALEDEQRQIVAAKRAKGITPEMDIKIIEKRTAEVRIIKRNFEIVVRVENEKVEVAKSQREAEDLLKEINF